MVSSAGIEPALQAPQACVLSVERRGPTSKQKRENTRFCFILFI